MDYTNKSPLEIIELETKRKELNLENDIPAMFNKLS